MIKNVQIDTNGVCGSKCWYCPVRYIPRPENTIMSEEMFRSILYSLVGIEPKPTIWLAAYNDILMDPLVSNRLSTLRHYNYRVPILTNGVGLSRNINTVDANIDIITAITIDLPAGNGSDYTKHTGNSSRVFDLIIDSIKTLYYRSPTVYKDKIHIHVNGVYDDTYARNQLKVDIPIGDTDKQVRELRALLPEVAGSIKDCRPLCDRAGNLREFAIDNSTMPCRGSWRLPMGATRVSGCNGGDRLNSWVHISSVGDLFLCCQDYKQETTYANLKDGCIINSFYSPAREQAIDRAMSGLCLKCQFSF